MSDHEPMPFDHDAPGSRLFYSGLDAVREANAASSLTAVEKEAIATAAAAHDYLFQTVQSIMVQGLTGGDTLLQYQFAFAKLLEVGKLMPPRQRELQRRWLEKLMQPPRRQITAKRIASTVNR